MGMGGDYLKKSNLWQWWRRGESNPRPRTINSKRLQV